MSGLLPIPDDRLKDRWGQFATVAGDGTGSIEMISDFSLGAIYKVQPPANEVWDLHSSTLHVEDNAKLSIATYGNGITLVNGIDLRVANDTGSRTLLGGQTIKELTHWQRYLNPADFRDFGNDGETYTIRADFLITGEPIRLVGADNARIEIVLNDNFTGLVSHTAFFTGVKVGIYQ